MGGPGGTGWGRGMGGPGGPGWRGGMGGSSSLWGKSEPRNPAEKKVLDVLAKLDGQRAGMANVPPEDGRLLRLLVGLVGAKRVVEIGTSNGYSTLWLALGLLSTGGKVTTFEQDADKVKLATKHFAEAGVSKLITVVQGDAHKKVDQVKGPIDLLFLDADKAGYLDYLKKLLPKVRAGGVIVAHNMVFPRPDPDFIKAITTNKGLVTVFVHLYGPGLAIALKKRG
jgi:predicted O-methyltransferase YrrM